MKKYSILMKLIVALCFLPQSINANDFGALFISIDKDGYTNIHKKPNVKSKIVGTVHKYQVFFCEMEFGEEATGMWLPINTDSISGFIYKEKVFSLDKLPVIKGYNTSQKSRRSKKVVTR
jgi:hypothetical protein